MRIQQPLTVAFLSFALGLPAFAQSSPVSPDSAVPDVGMTAEVLQGRQAKEEQSLRSISGLQAKHATLASFHRWLFTKHAAYAVEKPRRQKAGSLLLQTY